MATAHVVRGEAPVTSVTLTLTPFEAETLLALCAKVGGDSARRQVFSDSHTSIGTILGNALGEDSVTVLNRIRGTEWDFDDLSDVTGSVTFK